MVCEYGREVKLEFESSGMIAYPAEFDMRNKNGRYSHLTTKFGEEAGREISHAYFEAEPVVLYFDDVPVNRFYIPPDSFTFRRQMDRPTEATIDFKDAIQVLSRGIIEKDFSEEPLQEIINYIFTNRDDPNGVISGYRFVTESDAERTRRDITAGLADEPGPIISFLYDIIPQINEDELYTGFEFDGISPLEALSRVLNEFDLNYMVEPDGTIVFGTFGTDNNVFNLDTNDSDFTISRYDVTTSANRTNKVLLRGAYETIKTRDEAGIPDSTKLRPYATATAEGITGDSLELEARNVKSLSRLRETSIRALIMELMDDVNGSFVIDSMATEDEENLANLSLGDHIIVSENVRDECNKGVVAGTFIVQSIHHKASRSIGWTATVEVSQVAFPESISTSTFYYDPRTDQRFESIEAFNEYNDGPEGNEAYLPL